MSWKTLTIKLTFLLDDEDDLREYHLTVPNALTNVEIIDILKREHEILSLDDELSDIYGYQGRNPDTLLEYVCKKYHWNYESVNFDFGLTLE